MLQSKVVLLGERSETRDPGLPLILTGFPARALLRSAWPGHES
jgi:hypothetical protein